MLLILLIIVIVLLFGGYGYGYRYRGNVTGYGAPDLIGVLVFCLIVFLVLRLLGVV